MEQLAAEVQMLRQELERMKEKAVPNEVEMEQDDGDDGGDFEDLGSPSKWGAVLGSSLKTVVCPAAVDFVSMLQWPPPLDAIRSLEGEMVRFEGVPKTPPARLNRVDRRLTTVQKKLENTLHLIIQSLECKDDKCLAQAGAMCRSAWEDVLQQRKQLIAGRQTSKLDQRSDDTRPRLLNKDEGQRLQKQPNQARFQQSSRYIWGNATNQWGNNRPFNQPKGKGKCKGKGKSM